MADDDQVQDKSWNINHYILAGLCATLMVSAVVTIASVVLSPAQVTFSVTRATLLNTSNLMVTIAVCNPSRRCQASYRSVSINIRNSSTQSGTRFSIQANVVPVNTFPMDYVRGPNATFINSIATLVETEKDRASGYAHRLNSGAGLTVVVSAEVRFKIGVARTRLYDMTVFCPGVVFTDESSSSTAQANQQNFNCSG